MASGKMEQFAREYVKDYNATQAAIRAGYSEKTASSIGSRLLKEPRVLELVKENQKALVKKSCLTEEKIINKLENILDHCMSAVPVTEWDYSEHCLVETGLYQFDSKGALKAIELLGKHLGLFNDKHGSGQERKDDGFMEALEAKVGELDWQE